MSSVFMTGASGFLGARLLAALDRRGQPTVVLDRCGSIEKRIRSGEFKRVRTVQADLLEPAAYREALTNRDVVLHLAALTGRGTEEDHFRVNFQGTERLLDACRQRGVPRVLFTSSIATQFAEIGRYYYAKSKLRAEDAVRSSGLRFVIVRPTIILGPGSPVQAALEKLAGLPIVPIFGNGRARVQPIFVEDMVDFILALLDSDRFLGEALDLGGPAVLTIEELIQEIRIARTGSRGHAIHLPLGLLLPCLNAAERLGLSGLMPVNVGQLSSFRFDGTITKNAVYESRRKTLRRVSEMLGQGKAA